ncbi:hypothetical protein [Streptomyces venezuelae]|uniref:hypothetical protein n=1 Tax=Streptomyces venezuelae TaxID=54571 RepID=UPI0012384072|nr:hypothetical protein [Streptomyces venezuelae]
MSAGCLPDRDVVAVRPQSPRPREADTDAWWCPELSGFAFGDVARVGFGGRSERTLPEFAGPYR